MIQELTLSGSPFERGVSWGRAVGPQIREFLADRLARINALRSRPLSAADAELAVQGYANVMREWVPELLAEVRGLAQGAEIPEWQALLLQLRRELSEGSGEAADCSLLGVVGVGPEPVLAQTIDLAGGLTELGCVLRVEPEAGQPRQLLYTFLGLAGYLGINDRGLAVGINMVLADGWKPGIPPYLLVRRLLAQSSIDACLAELRRLPRSSSRTLTLCDERRVVSVEMTPSELRLLEGDVMIHTNHYLHSELLASERSHVLSRRSSKARYARLGKLMSVDGPAQAAVRAFDWLSDHEGGASAICCHGKGDVRRSETVAAVLMRPARGTLAVRQGPPCLSREQVYIL